MKTTNYILLFGISLFFHMACFGQMVNDLTISFDCKANPPVLTMEGSGTLYHYAEQTSQYRGIYYLFTDEREVEIDSESKLGKDCNIVFEKNDSVSKWNLEDSAEWVLGKSGKWVMDKFDPKNVNQDMLSHASISFTWHERAHLLVNANSKGQADKNKTLFLVVLPMPPQDTLFSSIEKNIVVDKTNGNLSGTVTINRTGRIVIDSVYVEDQKAPTTYHDGQHDHDTPYYRNEGFATVEIQQDWTSKTKDIGLTVFYTHFNNDGTLTHGLQKDFRINLFEKSFFAKYWWIFAAIVVILLHVFIIIRHVKRGSQLQIGTLKQENKRLTQELKKEHDNFLHEKEKRAKLEKDNMHQIKELDAMHHRFIESEHECADFKDIITKLQREIESLKRPTQARIDEAKYRQKCVTLQNEIKKIRESLKSNPSSVELNEKLRNLEKIIIINQ